MRKFHWVGLGYGIAIAPTLWLPTLAQAPTPPVLASTVKGDCGQEFTCDQLLENLRTQWPTAKLNCTRDRILALKHFQNPTGWTTSAGDLLGYRAQERRSLRPISLQPALSWGRSSVPTPAVAPISLHKSLDHSACRSSPH